MPTLIRFLRLLSIIGWLGSTIFFAFVLAPVAFHLLPSRHFAGIVVGGTLRVLDIVGLFCGSIFCATTALLYREVRAKIRGQYEAQILLVAVMLFGTAYLHAGILPAMEIDRSLAGGDIESALNTSSAKIHFERLHRRSEDLEGGILLCGLVVAFLMARETLPYDTINSQRHVHRPN